MTAFNSQHQRAIDAQSEPVDTHGEWLDSLAADMGDGEIVNLLDEAGVADTLFEAAIFAWRNDDFGYFTRTCERLAVPVIEAEAAQVAERMAEPEMQQ